MTFVENNQYHLRQQPAIAQVEQPADRPGTDPLIDYDAEYLIDFGVVLIVVAIVLIIGMINKQTKNALLFALALSACLIIILWNI